MSTVCKLDPEVRLRRAMRRNLLRNTKAANHEQIAILSELALIAGSSRMTGATKHALFERGAKQFVS